MIMINSKLHRRDMLVVSAGMFMGSAAREDTATAAPAENSQDVDSGLSPSGTFEIVAAFTNVVPSPVAVSPAGRVFIGFPRHVDDHRHATLAEWRDGTLIPFPNAAVSLPSDAPASQRLISAHGLTVDASGRLWVLDEGRRAGHPIPAGGAKIMSFDPESGELIANITLAPPALMATSYMNDIRIDLSHGKAGAAYIADSSWDLDPALVVVDLESNAQRRVLGNHRSTRPDQGFMAVLEGRPLVWGPPTRAELPTGGVDGITLSPDQSMLFYAPISSRRLYSIPTSVLSNFDASEAQLEAAVRDEGEKGFADGLCHDRLNRIYTTNGEHDSIFRRNADGSFDLIVRDPRLVWPDSVFATRAHLYATCSQSHRSPALNGGLDRRKPPFLVIRVSL